MKKLFLNTSLLFLTLLSAFTIYANLEPKPLHANAEPTDMVLLDLDSSPKQGFNLANKIRDIEGVTSCTYSSESKRISVLFNPKKCSGQMLKGIINGNGIQSKIPEFEGEAAAQCPIPHTFINRFEKIKYAFNFR
jgi:hypothetical protein